MALSIEHFLQGSFSFVFVLISVIVGSVIILKYFETKRKDFVLVGLTWIGLSTPWLADSINLILGLLSSDFLSKEVNFIIGNTLLPVFVLCWIKASTNLVLKEKQKLLLVIFLIIGVVFEILFFYLLFNDIDQIGVFSTPFQIVYGLFVEIFLIFFIAIFLIMGLLFSRETLKSDKPETRFKGKVLILAFISFAVGAFLDSQIPEVFMIARIVLITSAIEFYVGFMLPNWVKKLFHI
ncbi:MAG: hypothetical protein ACTSRI_06415 [Promethearchaeota archaeon]